ncbi:MAG TPA: M23 family metallopeptidase [Thermoanaerobaculaceae bacterium]|nr:M23 family metallopeptidase [Thermoanaerobaculaceae bacterium]
MPGYTLGTPPRRRFGWAAVVVVLVVVGAGVWGALRRSPSPAIAIESDRPAIGAATKIVAHFSEPAWGLGLVRLELVQGDRTETLAEQRFPRAGAFSPTRGRSTPTADLAATVGRSAQPWLKEGQAVVRATADRMAGPLRSHAPVVVEKRFEVRLRPPYLELLSKQHYVRQGGSGVAVLRVGASAARSGVRAGTVESLSFPLPGGGQGERFVLFAIPWDLDDANQIRLFAEDDAGNRAEMPFVDVFKPSPPRSDRLELSDAFLAKVVPAIASQTPGFDASGSLLDQYLRINGEVRRATLARIAPLAADTQPAFLWRGAFVQMPNTQKRANFAENRTYVYQGRTVDHQTHLGLDLASTEHAPVPAANAGRVVFAGWLAIYGNAVVIDHGYGLMSLYGHMSSLAVKEGDVVAKGQHLGSSGSTGLAGGDHLHLEIFVQGKSVDPLEWLDEHWIRDNIATKIKLP